jgi:hypothetical protein
MFVDAVEMKENPFWNVSCYVNQDYGNDSDKILGNNNCMTTGSLS